MSAQYALLSFTTDFDRGTSIPVGVVLWSKELNYAGFRVVEPDAKLRNFSLSHQMPFVQLMSEKLALWIESGELPLASERLECSDTPYWEHVRQLLIHQVRLSEPHPVDVREPEKDLEVLFRKFVDPFRSETGSERINGVLTKTLGDIVDKFEAKKSLPGRGGDIKVMRAYKGTQSVVVIEGVNLATENYAAIDETAGRLKRLIDGNKFNFDILLCYLAPPKGLNGAGPIVEWASELTRAKTFDLGSQAEALRQAARASIARADGKADFFEEEE